MKDSAAIDTFPCSLPSSQLSMMQCTAAVHGFLGSKMGIYTAAMQQPINSHVCTTSRDATKSAKEYNPLQTLLCMAVTRCALFYTSVEKFILHDTALQSHGTQYASVCTFSLA